MSVAPAWRAGRPRVTRKAAALGVALALHMALVVAWDHIPDSRYDRAASRPAMSLPEASVLWLKLLPASHASSDAAASPPTAAPAQGAEASPQPQAAAAPPSAGEPPVLEAQLQQRGVPWSLGYPDTELSARRVVLGLHLALDAEQRVHTVEASSTPAQEELVSYVRDHLLGAVLQGHASSARQSACMEVSFDADAARVSWRLMSPTARPDRPCPAPARG
jgi:hypothetical protein